MLSITNRAINIIFSQRGMVLPLVLIFAAALLAFGAALLNYSLSDKIISDYYSLEIEKYYLAESGLEAGFAILQQDFNYSGIVNENLGKGSFKVSFIDSAPNKRTIVSEGKLDDYSLSLKMLIENDPLKGPVIIKWLGE